MAVAGVGGLIGQAMFPGLDDTLAKQITPNPSPLAQQGGPPVPGAVTSTGQPAQSEPQPGSNLAPPASTQNDPQSYAYAKAMIDASRRDAMARGINEGMDSIAAGFGTAQQQASKQAQIRAGGGGVGDSLGDLAGIQKMQDTTIADNEHARFMSNAAVFAQTLRGQGINVTDAQATEIMNNPGLLQRFGEAAGANAATTGTQKDADAATKAYADAHPDATPKDIADYKANLIAGGMTGGDLETRQYLEEKRNGLTTDDYPTWKAKHVAAAGAMATQAKDVQEFKDTGKQDFSTADQKLTKSESTVDALLKDVDSTRKALSDPDFMTTGRFAANAPAWMTADPKVKAAAANINTLKNELSASGLSGVKNVRNIREFNAISGALTSALDPNNPDLEGALRDIKTKFATAHAQALAAAGKPIPYAYKDVVDPTYLDKNNPYYTGSALEDPPKGSETGPTATQPPAPDAKQAPDGKWYVPDPARPGKYLRVD